MIDKILAVNQYDKCKLLAACVVRGLPSIHGLRNPTRFSQSGTKKNHLMSLAEPYEPISVFPIQFL